MSLQQIITFMLSDILRKLTNVVIENFQKIKTPKTLN